MKPPDRWLNYKAHGVPIDGMNIIAFKVPLDEVASGNLPLQERFTPEHLMNAYPELKFVIDLTNTQKYYRPQKFKDAGVCYQKIWVPGHAVPKNSCVYQFFDAMDRFRSAAKNGELIGVHCTHGINRTGYLICRYLVERLSWEPQRSVKAFEAARGYAIERLAYVEDLMNMVPRRNNVEDLMNMEPRRNNVEDSMNMVPRRNNVEDLMNMEPRRNNVEDSMNMVPRRNNVEDFMNMVPRRNNVEDFMNMVPRSNNDNALNGWQVVRNHKGRRHNSPFHHEEFRPTYGPGPSAFRNKHDGSRPQVCGMSPMRRSVVKSHSRSGFPPRNLSSSGPDGPPKLQSINVGPQTRPSRTRMPPPRLPPPRKTNRQPHPSTMCPPALPPVCHVPPSLGGYRMLPPPLMLPPRFPNIPPPQNLQNPMVTNNFRIWNERPTNSFHPAMYNVRHSDFTTDTFEENLATTVRR